MKSGSNFLRPHIFNVLVRIVHHGVKLACDVQKLPVDPLNPPAEGAVQLFHGVAGGPQALFQSLGFQVSGVTDKGHSYALKL